MSVIVKFDIELDKNNIRKMVDDGIDVYNCDVVHEWLISNFKFGNKKIPKKYFKFIKIDELILWELADAIEKENFELKMKEEKENFEKLRELIEKWKEEKGSEE